MSVSDFSDADGSVSDGSWDSTEFGIGEETVRDTSNDEEKEIKEIARKETRSVRRWRLIVVSLMAITGGILSTVTYRLLRGENTDDYLDAVSILVHSQSLAFILIPKLTTTSLHSTIFSLIVSRISQPLASKIFIRQFTIWDRPSQRLHWQAIQCSPM